MNKLKLTFHYFLCLFISLFFSIFLSIFNHFLFVESVVDSKYLELFESKRIPMPDGKNREVKIDIKVDFPVKSLIFFYSVLSIYWYFFGVYLKKKFKKQSVYLFFLIPLFIGIAYLDRFYVLLFILSIFGYLSTDKEIIENSNQ